jgi:hypothetical protein
MKIFIQIAICTLTFVMSCNFSEYALAAELDSQKDYIIFTSSLRNRKAGELRFKEIVKIIYGNPANLIKVFGKEGPPSLQKIKLQQGERTVRLKASGTSAISSIRFQPNAGSNSPYLSLNLIGAKCKTSANSSAQTCNGTLQIFKSKNSIRGRVEFVSDTGLRITSGNSDVSSSHIYVPELP